MKWLRTIIGLGQSGSDTDLEFVREKFQIFRQLLSKHDNVLRLLSDMDEKAQGEYLFDLHYIKSSLRKMQADTYCAIELMVSMGGEKYNSLFKVTDNIFSDLEQIIPLSGEIIKDDLVIPYDILGRDKIKSVGGKNAQLGEMKSRLGLPVPEGFAITAWAYKLFVNSNNLQERITECLENLNIRSSDDLISCGERMREMVMQCEVPDEISKAILESSINLQKSNSITRFAMRSSALGEDSIHSFAGQYASILNVTPDKIIDKYKEVIAGKFTPQAIYYFLSQALSEQKLAMSVACVEMIDARASGVIYTRNPIDTNDSSIMISSIWGLGKYLVDGKLTPDTFRVSRKEGSILSRTISKKEIKLGLSENSGTCEKTVPIEEQEIPSLNNDQLRELARYAAILENHYELPQDIEFVVDKKGKIYLLQTRTLRIFKSSVAKKEIDTSNFDKLSSGGVTISPGAGSGNIFHASSLDDLSNMPDRAVLVTPNPFPGIVTVMKRVSAIVTGIGGMANHMATIVREFRVPTLGNVENIKLFKNNDEVTVDATNCVVYRGIKHNLIEARRGEVDLFSDLAIFEMLKQILKSISPLNLLHPQSKTFTAENCRTIHDICRYIHQKVIEEMFDKAIRFGGKKQHGLRLKTELPTDVRLICLDQDHSPRSKEGYIDAKDLYSVPMIHFWKGIAKEGWPSVKLSQDFKRVEGPFIADGNLDDMPEFRETSFAILSHDYMICNLHMGYHFTTVEAMCTSEPDSNYIRMQWGEGGAMLEKRVRRINLIADVTRHLGFENYSKADYMDVVLAYISEDEIKEKLILLGRLTMMSKQLDMALSNDEVAGWYKKDMMQRLGILNKADNSSGNS